jgi:hypothetical protein
MTEPHSHRGEPRDEENEDIWEPHTPVHVAVVEEAEEQPA